MGDTQIRQRVLVLHSNEFMGALMTTHTLIQAGCDPVPFALALVVLTVCFICVYMRERHSYLNKLPVTMFTMTWCFLMLGLAREALQWYTFGLNVGFCLIHICMSHPWFVEHVLLIYRHL